MVTCSLSSEAFQQRLADWSEVTSKGTTRHLDDGRIVTTYPRNAHLLERLRALIAAEAECCSFLDFEVTERANEIVVELRIPDGAADDLVSVFDGRVVP
jgi:hypothetical protein